MAVAWLKKIFGGNEAAPADAPSQTAEPKPSKDASASSSSTTNSYIYDEYHAELDRAFCLELFGSELAYQSSSEVQRSSARQIVKKLAQANVKTDQLPRKPSTLPSLMKLLKQDDLSYSQISESLLKDPSLTSQVLKTANSPFFRLSNNTVESLDQAILIMGVGGIKKVVSAAILLPVFKGEEKSNAFSEAVWEWALSSGKAVDVLFQSRGESEGSAYLLGLLPALALLLICQEISTLEDGRPEEHKLLPIQKLHIFKSVGWKYCMAIRKEWGLPEEFDAYLYGLKDPKDQQYSDSLCAALLVAQYALIKAKGGTQLSLEQLSEITGSSLEENKRVMAQLAGRIANTNG